MGVIVDEGEGGVGFKMKAKYERESLKQNRREGNKVSD